MLRYLLATFALSSALLVAAACGSDDNDSMFGDGNVDSGGDGSGGNSSGGFGPGDDSGGGGEETDAGQVGVLKAVIRDFRLFNQDASVTNPDFENITAEMENAAGAQSGLSEGSDKYSPYVYGAAGPSIAARFSNNIVQPDLDSDGIPVYTTAVWPDAGFARTYTTHGKSFFDEWYRDVPGKNIRREVPITLTNDGNGVYTYDSALTGVTLGANTGGYDASRKEFFPIDDGSDASTDFGNQGDPHNYSFTVELRTKFKYKGTEKFKFSGDDDVFVFINKKLVINIGGIHEILTKEINVADWAAEAGLTVGNEYTLDFFQAERHRTESNLRIETTLDLKANTTVK